MGWTEYRATKWKKGKIDRKAECDAYFMEGLNRGHFEVLKSTMHGGVYYAAVRNLTKCVGKDENGKYKYESIENGDVFGVVFLTSIRDKYYFAYKDMDESEIPYCYDCPESILKLLSDTDNKNALEWRRLCRENRKEKKEHSLSALAIGTKILWIRPDGTKIKLYKHEPGYQFKRPFWMMCDSRNYIQKRRIVNWELCEED